MNKNKLIKIIGIIILIGVLVATGFLWFTNQQNTPQESEDEECFGKGCVKVQTTCCSCNMGGEEKCVKESEVAKYKEKLNNCPKDLLCPAVYNCIIESCNTKEE